MPQNQEIERKFLVQEMPEVAPENCTDIVQGYICRGSGRTVRIRLRASADQARGYLTIKGPSLDGGLSRFEWEKEISGDDARQLLELCDQGVIEKTRCLVPEVMPDGTEGPHVFEVDVFHGKNEGLVVAEVELGSADECFCRPSWLGEEVTGDKRYYNSHLSICPFSEW